MANEYMVVSTKVLPKCFELVAKAKKILQDGKAENVSEACKMCGISRSTFYKYQDDVFFYHEEHKKKVVFSLMLSHQPGALSNVCNVLSECKASILTMSQSEPVGDVAPILMSCDITVMDVSINELRENLVKLDEVKKIEILSLD